MRIQVRDQSTGGSLSALAIETTCFNYFSQTQVLTAKKTFESFGRSWVTHIQFVKTKNVQENGGGELKRRTQNGYTCGCGKGSMKVQQHCCKLNQLPNTAVKLARTNRQQGHHLQWQWWFSTKTFIYKSIIWGRLAWTSDLPKGCSSFSKHCPKHAVLRDFFRCAPP